MSANSYNVLSQGGIVVHTLLNTYTSIYCTLYFHHSHFADMTFISN